MRAILFEGAAKRWSLGVALLAGVAALLMASSQGVEAQQPPAPHWFWGNDADSYAGSEVKVFNQNGAEISSGGEGSGQIGSDGSWYVSVSRDDASQVKLRIVSSSGDRETSYMDVIEGGFSPSGLSISAFTPVVDLTDDVEDLEDTLAVRIRARVYPSSEDSTIPFRSIEFNLIVNGVPQSLNDNPRERTIRPNHASGRWYRSNWFDLGDGFRAAVIACKDQEGGVRFGVRVDGRDDIIPRFNLLGASRTSTGWAASNPEIDIMRPGDDLNPNRAGRGDANCRYGKDN